METHQNHGAKGKNADSGGKDHKQEHGQHHESKGHGAHHAHMVADFRRRFWVSLAFTVPILAMAPLIQGFLGLEKALAFRGDSFVRFALASIVYFYGGWPFLKGWFSELYQKAPGMMTLIGVAVTVAYAYSSAVVFGLPGKIFFWELATLIDIMLLGHWFEMRSIMGASGALEELAKLLPSTAHKIISGDETEDVPVDSLSPGNEVLVKPGEKFPVDGKISRGRTTVNESMITGESRPTEKGEDDEVLGGSVNGESAVRVEVSRTGADAYLSRVVEMVKKAQKSKSRAQSTADRAAKWLTVAALTAGGITLAAWLWTGREFVFALERMVTVMVITCPHALGLAVPLVVAVSTSIAAGQGLLIRNRTAFEGARNLQAIIFDKTGTLTTGQFGVTAVVAFESSEKSEVLAMAAGLEVGSEHPIAAGILAKAEQEGLDLPGVEDFSAIPGKGAQGMIDGRNVKVVSPGYLAEKGIEIAKSSEPDMDGKGKTVVYVLLDDEPAGAIMLADMIRQESQDAVDRLKKAGLMVMMLTGDTKAVAQWVADQLGLSDYFAEVLPDQKAKKIKEVQDKGLVVAMVGDGINDAPALAQADLGIAIGAGTDVAMEAADLVLVRSNPADVARIVELASATHRKVIQNLWWAAGYNIVAIPLAAGILYAPFGFIMPPAVGAIIMSLSTVIVAVNAKLLKGHFPKIEQQSAKEASS